MRSKELSASRVYWTAFIGLFFDYYDLYLFVYLEKVLAAQFGLTVGQSNLLQFAGIAGVGLGALGFGFLADRHGRGRMMMVVFALYVASIAGLSLAWDFGSVLGFRVLASLALGAEWGISHTFLAEHVGGARRYRYAALLQFAILGGLLAAWCARFVLPVVGWRWLFAASIPPVAALSMIRGRWLVSQLPVVSAPTLPAPDAPAFLPSALIPATSVRMPWAFLQCFGIASLTIASGTVNVFFAKELPQSPLYTALFWANIAPGMLVGAWIVRRFGVRRALSGYAVALVLLSSFAWVSRWSGRNLAFALALPLLNGVPFGLMGAYFNEVFSGYRTMLSGAAYNLGRILAGFAPALITALGLNSGGRYFLFTAVLGLGVFVIGVSLPARAAVRPATG
jgi:putative MFS transporter